MENEKAFTENDSLAVISKMIKTAQQNFRDGSFYYIFWGWMVFIAAVANYILLMTNYSYPTITWAILMPLGGIISGIYSYRHERGQKVTTYTDEIMRYVVIAFLGSLFTTLLMMPKLGSSTYPIVLLIYAIWLFVSGGAIKFKPLVIGGIINWVAAVVCFYVNYEQQLLVISLAVLSGYIIPGYLLKARYKKQQAIN
jgi:hypothetical protein